MEWVFRWRGRRWRIRPDSVLGIVVPLVGACGGVAAAWMCYWVWWLLLTGH